MNEKKGFIQIVATIVILGMAVLGFSQYGDYKNNSNKQFQELSNQIDDLRAENIKLGGSLVGIQYGGTGTSTVGWGGLIRYAGGYMGTTTLTDADVPDAITITGLTNLNLATATINYLAATTSVFTNAPTINATATAGTDAVNKNLVNPVIQIATTTGATSTTQLRYSTTTWTSGITATTPTLIRDINVRANGYILTSFDAKPDASGNSYGQIVISNGIFNASGTSRTLSGGSATTTYTETFFVMAGSQVKLYCWAAHGSYPGACGFLKIYWNLTDGTIPDYNELY